MGDRFLFTSSVGAFLFSEQGEIADKILFNDAAAACKKLELGEWLGEEKVLAKKAGKILFLGVKKEKIEGITFTSDIKKLEITAAKLAQYSQKAMEAALKTAKAKVRDSVGDDELISQSISALQEIDKSASMLAKRLREWHGLVNPELSADISDNTAFVRKTLETNEKSEMGASLSADDRAEIAELANNIMGMLTLRNRQEKYLEIKMKKTCPNVMAIAGVSIGAKLVSGAGSLRRLAVMPASTLQLLGAEKSMFNFLRRKSKKMPRFGILHEHKFVASAPEKEKGKAARLLADKISIAARVDFFNGEFIGDKLLKEIEARLK